jgi:hypothetical protein
MSRFTRSLFAAAAAMTALAAFPASASASPDRGPHPAAPAQRVAPPPAPHVVPARRLEERERASRELRELALARERFYAAHPTRWEVARFERWYASRRAELERRWGFRPADFDRR